MKMITFTVPANWRNTNAYFNMVPAIKALRNLTGLDLKSAKDAIDDAEYKPITLTATNYGETFVKDLRDAGANVVVSDVTSFIETDLQNLVVKVINQNFEGKYEVAGKILNLLTELKRIRAIP